jgi:cytochrome c-type biogenesis protein CcsB
MILSYAALFIGCLLSILYIGTAWYFNWNTGEGAEGLITAAACDEVVPYTLSTMEAPAAKPYADVAADAAPPLPYSLPWPMQSRKLFFSQLDSLSYRILAFAFPLLTLGILSGSIWANEAWGSYWSWDPKETWAFITWLIFAFYLHTRLQYNWEGQKSALIASIGFFIVWMCYLGVNLLGKGLHSYGWVSPL